MLRASCQEEEEILVHDNRVEEINRRWEMVISKKNLIGIFLFFFTLSTLTGCSSSEAPRPISSSKQEKDWGDAPDFTLPKLEGGELTLSSLKGKVIILDFWATYCSPCRREIPGFIELYKKYKDEGLEIVGVCIESESIVKRFAKEMGMKYVLVFANREISQQYGGIRYIPTTFIIDRNGDIAKKHVGLASKETFEQEIKELLGK